MLQAQNNYLFPSFYTLLLALSLNIYLPLSLTIIQQSVNVGNVAATTCDFVLLLLPLPIVVSQRTALTNFPSFPSFIVIIYWKRCIFGFSSIFTVSISVFSINFCIIKYKFYIDWKMAGYLWSIGLLMGWYLKHNLFIWYFE